MNKQNLTPKNVKFTMSFSSLKSIRDKKSRNIQHKNERHQSIKTDVEVTEMLKLAGKATNCFYKYVLFVSGDIHDIKGGFIL